MSAHRFGAPLFAPGVQYSYLDAASNMRLDYHGEIVWSGAPLPAAFTETELTSSPDGNITFVLTNDAPEPYDTYGEQTHYGDLLGAAVALWTWDGTGWTGGDSTIGPGPIHLTIAYEPARAAEPAVNVLLADGFTLHDVVGGVGWELVPGSDVNSPPLRSLGAAAQVGGFQYPNVMHFFSGEVNSSIDRAKADAYTRSDTVVEVTLADVGNSVAVPAGASLLVTNTDDQVESYVVVTDTSFSDYGAKAVFVTAPAIAAITLDGDILTATLDIDSASTEELYGSAYWPFIDRFDRTAGAWLEPLLMPRRGDGARYAGDAGFAVPYGDDDPKIFFGGFEGDSTTGQEFFELNVATSVFTQKADVPFWARFAGAVNGARIHALSETHSSSGPGQVGIYNPGNNTWTEDVLNFDVTTYDDVDDSSGVAHTTTIAFGFFMTERGLVRYDSATLTATLIARVPVTFERPPIMWLGPEASLLIHYWGYTNGGFGEIMAVHCVYAMDLGEWFVERREWFGPLKAAPYYDAQVSSPITYNGDGFWLPSNQPGIYTYTETPRAGLPDYRHTFVQPGESMWADNYFVDWVGGDMSALLAVQDINDIAAAYPTSTGTGYFGFEVFPGHAWDRSFNQGDAKPFPVMNLNGLNGTPPSWDEGSDPPLSNMPAGPYMITVQHDRQHLGVDSDPEGMYIPPLIPGMTYTNVVLPPPPEAPEWTLVSDTRALTVDDLGWFGMVDEGPSTIIGSTGYTVSGFAPTEFDLIDIEAWVATQPGLTWIGEKNQQEYDYSAGEVWGVTLPDGAQLAWKATGPGHFDSLNNWPTCASGDNSAILDNATDYRNRSSAWMRDEYDRDEYAWPFLERFNLTTGHWLPRIMLPVFWTPPPVNDRGEWQIFTAYNEGDKATITPGGGEPITGYVRKGVTTTQPPNNPLYWQTNPLVPLRYAAEGGFVAQHDGKLYFGGGDGQYEGGGSFFMFDPDTEEFTALPNLPIAPDYSPYGQIGETLYVVIGTTLWACDLSTLEWTSTALTGPTVDSDWLRGVEFEGKLIFVLANVSVVDVATATVTQFPMFPSWSGIPIAWVGDDGLLHASGWDYNGTDGPMNGDAKQFAIDVNSQAIIDEATPGVSGGYPSYAIKDNVPYVFAGGQSDGRTAIPPDVLLQGVYRYAFAGSGGSGGGVPVIGGTLSVIGGTLSAIGG